MSAINLQRLAQSLSKAGAPGMPTIMLTRELPLYEVEFAALEFAEEARLRSADWAVLALADALGQVSPATVDEYLGLGPAVAETILHRLLDDKLLQHGGQAPPEESGMLGFFQHFLSSLQLGGKRMVRDKVPPPPLAHPLYASSAATTPQCQLSHLGSAALARNAVPQRLVRSARLVFLADPLLFLEVADERQQRNTQYRRPLPLAPDKVPLSLRTLDTTLALAGEARLPACGIENGIAGMKGQLTRAVPGSQWEVREVQRRGSEKQQRQTATLILAAFHSTSDGLIWQVFLRQDKGVQACSQVNAMHLLEADLRTPAGLLAAMTSDMPLPKAGQLRNDGAFELTCDSAHLPQLIGDQREPCDALMPALINGWQGALRVHAMPADSTASRLAFYEFLSHRNADLRRNFDATCTDLSASLTAYWGHNPGLPSADDAALNLWSRPELRTALCMRRLQRDLVQPYVAMEEQA